MILAITASIQACKCLNVIASVNKDAPLRLPPLIPIPAFFVSLPESLSFSCQAQIKLSKNLFPKSLLLSLSPLALATLHSAWRSLPLFPSVFVNHDGLAKMYHYLAEPRSSNWRRTSFSFNHGPGTTGTKLAPSFSSTHEGISGERAKLLEQPSGTGKCSAMILFKRETRFHGNED